MFKREITLALTFAAALTTALAKTWYASPAGTTGAPGTLASPFLSIQAAVDSMRPGDTLLLRGGTYRQFNINLRNKRGRPDAWFTMASYPGEWAVVDGGHPGANTHIFHSQVSAAYSPCFWTFEYFEVTGAGPDTTGKTYADIQSMAGAGFFFWPGSHMTFDHMYIHDNYGGGGPNGGAGIKFMNESGNAAHHVTISYCHLKDNGWPGSSNTNLGNVIFFADYRSDPVAVNQEIALSRNTIMYSLLEGSSAGFKYKNAQRLTGDHSGQNMKYKEYGSKYHHNIIRNARHVGLYIQGDFDQAYNNIIENCPRGIMFGDPPSNDRREQFHITAYNNTVIGSSIVGIILYRGETTGISNYMDPPVHPYQSIWNNIIYKGPTSGQMKDLSMFPLYRPLPIDMATLKADNNYFHPRTRSDVVLKLGSINSALSVDQYQDSAWARSLYAMPERPDDPLFKPDPSYRTRGEHVVKDSITIQFGGVGGPHPYLTGVIIPSYVGATDPADDGWVAEVEGLVNLPTRRAPCRMDTAYSTRSDTTRYRIIAASTVRTITTCQPISTSDTTMVRDTVPE